MVMLSHCHFQVASNFDYRRAQSVLRSTDDFNFVGPFLIYISLWIDSLFEIRKIAVCFLWLLLPGDYKVTDEALLAETT